MTVRVIGLGQRAAGDDGVGLAVLDALKAEPPPSTELSWVSDAARLVELTQDAELVVLVDAALDAGPAGQVSELALGALDESPLCSVSTHGLSVAQTLALAGMLAGGSLPAVRIIAIAIERPSAYSTTLSPPVAAAVVVAAQRVRDLVLAHRRPE
ncbi:MAG: hydrogenase maturation protease [Myxococcales bacterium]|nr:hydrogenase maturation protease [Myxococcales bacterium]